MKTSSAIETLKNPTPQDFFVIDIDSTLVSTHQRNQVILTAFIDQHKDLYPTDCEILAKVKCQEGDYGLSSGLERVGFDETRPESKKSLDEFWRKHFFSNLYLSADQPTGGAIEWVESLQKKNVPYVFLTARHKATMWDGTLSSLTALGFKISPETLILKEDLRIADEDFKSQAMQKIVQQQESKNIWFIDNEPVVLNRIAADHPSVNLVWFESTHSGRMSPPPGITSLQDFQFS